MALNVNLNQWIRAANMMYSVAKVGSFTIRTMDKKSFKMLKKFFKPFVHYAQTWVTKYDKLLLEKSNIFFI